MFYVHTMEVNGKQNCLVTNILQIYHFYFPQKTESNSYSFGTWWWINVDRISHFWRNYPLNAKIINKMIHTFEQKINKYQKTRKKMKMTMKKKNKSNKKLK